VLIGKTAKDVTAEAALDYVSGYAVALDLTLRDVQGVQKTKGLPWEIAKAFDTSCPLSDFVPTSQVDNPQELQLQLIVSGEGVGRIVSGDRLEASIEQVGMLRVSVE
jgi:5-carboxymethyl-2-hydroxymuconate isomerase